MFDSVFDRTKKFIKPRTAVEIEQRNIYLKEVGSFVLITGSLFLFRKQISQYYKDLIAQ